MFSTLSFSLKRYKRINKDKSLGDVDDVFLPSPSDLLANLSNCREQVVNMLTGEIVRLFFFVLYCQIARLYFLLHCLIGSKTTFKLLHSNIIWQIYPSFSTAVRKQRTASVQPFRPPTKW